MGTLAAHRGSMADLPEQLAWASEFSLFKHLHQQDSWVEDYKDPTVGATLFIGSVGNNNVLGRFAALYGFSELPLLSLKHFELSWKFGTGLAVTNRKFDPIFNPDNIAIGSHLNMMIVMALKAQYRNKKSSYSLGLDITHFSNSAFQVPNLGLNVPYLSLGYSRKIGFVRNPLSDQKPSFIRKKIYLGVNNFTRSRFNNTKKSMFNKKYLSKQTNALEKVAFLKYPKLKKVKFFLEKLKNPFFVRMTGSGSVIAAYYLSKKDCDVAKVQFKRKFENYWCNTSKTL